MEKKKLRRFDEGGDCGGRAMQWFWGRLSWENVKTKIKSMSLLINCFLLLQFTNYVDCWVHSLQHQHAALRLLLRLREGGFDRTGI